MYDAVVAESPALSLLALQQAIAELGQVGSSKEHREDTYLASVGLQSGQPWCQAFVYWCYKQAAHQLEVGCPVPKTGSALTCWNFIRPDRRITRADARTRTGLVRPGAQFVLDFGGGFGHAGLVELIEGELIHTIEADNDDGHIVCRRTRKLTDSLLKGFLNF